MLCAPCAAAIPACAGLEREHVRSRCAAVDAAAWLIDPFGVPHAVSGARTTIGRRPDADLVLLHGSISRDHAELTRAGDRWQLRDTGSRNHTHVDGRRIDRAEVASLTTVRIGEVAMWFVGQAIALDAPVRSTPTAQGGGTLRLTLRASGRELCVVGPDVDAAPGGALLHRAAGVASWAEVDLPALEFQLLRTLCRVAPGCRTSKQLAAELAFPSRYPSEDNVRQLVRRFRVGLARIGAEDLIEAVPSRGYRLAWEITT